MVGGGSHYHMLWAQVTWASGSCRCSSTDTGKQVVNRIITEIAVFDVTPDGLLLIEHAPDITVEEIQKRTEATFKLSPSLSLME